MNYARIKKGRKNAGGGVSIAFNPNRISLNKFNVATKGHEITVARGKIKENKRPFFIVGVYISTRLKPKQVADFVETVGLIVMKIKADCQNPYIIIGGDFNGADVTPLIVDYPDLSIAQTGPTRGEAALDLAITNLGEELEDLEVRSPLINDKSGKASDHAVILCKAALRHRHEFVWIKKRYRKITQKGIEEAAERINQIDWDQLPEMSDPDTYVEAMHRSLIGIIDEKLPWKTTKFRSTDDPWINDTIRKRKTQRKGVFRREGRSHKWKRLKHATTKMIDDAREAYYD